MSAPIGWSSFIKDTDYQYFEYNVMYLVVSLPVAPPAPIKMVLHWTPVRKLFVSVAVGEFLEVEWPGGN